MHRHPCLSLWLIALLGLSTEAVPQPQQRRANRTSSGSLPKT